VVPSGFFDLSQEGSKASEASDKPGTAEGTIPRPEGFEGKAGSWLKRSKSSSEGGRGIIMEKMRSSDCPKGSISANLIRPRKIGGWGTMASFLCSWRHLAGILAACAGGN
jgi:hypothetical protein